MGDQVDIMRKAKPILHDPNIIPRVKQYLEENVHKTYVDVTDMARVLQERYRAEYGRRKMAPFRQLVEQAYKTVLHSYGLDSNPSSDDNEESDLEFMDDRSGNHVVSNMLTDMYLNKSAPKKPVSNEIAINISSDESDDDADMAQKTSEHSEKATHPTTTTNPNQVTIIKVANVPAKPLPVNQSTQHQPKKRKIRSDSVSPVHNAANVTTEKPKRPATTASSFTPAKIAKKFRREFSAQQSKLTFEDIGGMKKVLQELCELLMHIKHPEVYRHIGLPPPRGFLLHGPPGSGKTLLAHAIAGQLNIGLIPVAATELVAGVSGESEERIRDLFEQATALAPCVLFIDEIDAISSNRLNAQKDMERRIVAQLLSCLDGLSQHEHGDQVLIIGATNRPDALDPALRRVGRFDQEISLGIPDRGDRANILQVICKRLTIGLPFDYDQLGALTPGYVGADLLALASRAASIAVKRAFTKKQRDTIVNSDETSVDKLLMEIDALPLTKDDEQNNVKENGTVEKEAIDDSERSTNGTDVVVAVEKTNEEEERQDKESVDVESLETAEPTVVNEETPIKDDAVPNETATPMQVDEQIKHTSDEAEKVEAAVTAAEDDEIIEVLDESCSSATKNEKSIHSQISFDAMKSWLSDDKPIMTSDDLDDLCITMTDFTEALKVVQPSAKREGFITVPDVTWDDIGSLRDIREELQLAVLAPVKFPKKLQALGLNSPSGVLLCGPPGCGKTLLAKAVANEAGVNFISVKGPELLNMYVGESERAVRQCFQRARNSAPCVIFFDEFDSLCPKRSDSGENNGSSRLVNQLLTEMDGIEDRKGVFLMAATNRPDIVDPAVMRPGRLDKILYVGLPELEDRVEILRAVLKEKPILADDVDINELAALTDSYTGADLAGLVRQASLYALKESIASSSATSQISVSKSNFLNALKHTKSSISEQDKRHYEKLRKVYTVTQD